MFSSTKWLSGNCCAADVQRALNLLQAEDARMAATRQQVLDEAEQQIEQYPIDWERRVLHVPPPEEQSQSPDPSAIEGLAYLPGGWWNPVNYLIAVFKHALEPIAISVTLFVEYVSLGTFTSELRTREMERELLIKLQERDGVHLDEMRRILEERNRRPLGEAWRFVIEESMTAVAGGYGGGGLRPKLRPGPKAAFPKPRKTAATLRQQVTGTPGSCFLAGTEVHVDADGGGVWFVAAAGIVALTVAAPLVADRRRRQTAQADLRDEVFANEKLDELWEALFDDDSPSPEPELTEAEPIMQTEISQAHSGTATAVKSRTKPAPTSKRTSKPRARFNPFTLFAMLAGLLLSGFCLYEGVTHSQPGTKPIERLEPGDHVRAENPTGEQDLEFGTEVDPPTWRLIELLVPKSDGSQALVKLLRPLWWLELHEAQVGGLVPLSVPECGIDGEARVLSIAPCPKIKPPRPGYRIVTGTFQHFSAKVIALHVEGLPEPIGTTANHPFWSEDRRDYVRADQLRSGERLSNFEGNPRVTRVAPREGQHTVYNLEVQVDHVYHVASGGILVHNALPLECVKQRMRELKSQGYSKAEIKDIIRKEFSTTMRVENFELLGGRRGRDFVLYGDDGLPRFEARMFDGERTLSIGWTDNVPRTAIRLREVQQLAGGHGSFTRITGMASYQLESAIRAGTFNTEKAAEMLNGSLGGQWRVNLVPRSGQSGVFDVVAELIGG